MSHESAVFFFSSRRRHTRFDCDWSSDVCSSDLLRSSSRNIGMPGSCSSNTWFLPGNRSEEHTSELQSQSNLVCRLLLEKKKKQLLKRIGQFTIPLQIVLLINSRHLAWLLIFSLC